MIVYKHELVVLFNDKRFVIKLHRHTDKCHKTPKRVGCCSVAICKNWLYPEITAYDRLSPTLMLHTCMYVNDATFCSHIPTTMCFVQILTMPFYFVFAFFFLFEVNNLQKWSIIYCNRNEPHCKLISGFLILILTVLYIFFLIFCQVYAICKSFLFTFN